MGCEDHLPVITALDQERGRRPNVQSPPRLVLSLLVRLWALFVLALICLFFYNYGGGWIYWIAERLPLRY